MNLYQAKVAVSNEVTLSGFERLANLGGEKLECDDLHFSHFLLFAPPLSWGLFTQSLLTKNIFQFQDLHSTDEYILQKYI